MDHNVDSEGEAMAADKLGHQKLMRVRSRSRKAIRLCLIGVLQTQLNMIESCIDQRLQPFGVESQRRCNHIHVQTTLASCSDEFGKVRAGKGLSTSQMQMHNA